MSEWISVKQQIPTDGTPVLLMCGEWAITGSCNHEIWRRSDNTVIPPCNVTHWMPLPEPPAPEPKSDLIEYEIVQGSKMRKVMDGNEFMCRPSEATGWIKDGHEFKGFYIPGYSDTQDRGERWVGEAWVFRYKMAPGDDDYQYTYIPTDNSGIVHATKVRYRVTS